MVHVWVCWVCVCVSAGCLCVHFRFGACHGDVVTSVRGVHFAVASVVLCSLKCKNKYHTHTHTHTRGSFHRSLSLDFLLLLSSSLYYASPVNRSFTADWCGCVRACVCVCWYGWRPAKHCWLNSFVLWFCNTLAALGPLCQTSHLATLDPLAPPLPANRIHPGVHPFGRQHLK